MKLISWNVNGLRACVKKGFMEFFHQADADFICIQESKLSAGQIELELPGYYQFWNYAEKKGYSGTAVFTKQKPMEVFYGIHQEKHNKEGRVITLEYQSFYLVTVYTPNSKRGLERLPYRLEWEDAFREYVVSLKQKKGIIICGDMNVAHKEIDLKNPSANKKNSGFTIEERGKFTQLLESGFVDTFRYFYPDKTDAYSWWSYLNRARERNIGWRIDYFLVSEDLKECLINAAIHTKIYGSDHCPVELTIR